MEDGGSLGIFRDLGGTWWYFGYTRAVLGEYLGVLSYLFFAHATYVNIREQD